jgi:hypothetical protein
MNSDRKKINKIYSQIDKIALGGRDNFLDYYQYVDDSVTKSDYDNLLQCLYYHYNIDIEKLKTVEDIKKKTWKQIRLLTNLTLTKRISKLYDSKKVYQVSFNIFSNDPNFIVTNLSQPLSTTYSIVGTSSRISITRTNSTLNLNVLNDKVYDITISKATWTGTPSTPSNVEIFQELKGVTQSSYRLEIPTTFDSQWIINTKERTNLKELNYSLSLSTNKYLGKIVETEYLNEETKYYIKNKMFSKIMKTRKSFLEVTKVDILTTMIFDDYNFEISDDENTYNKYVDAINFLLS